MRRVFCRRLEAFVQARERCPRLFDSEIEKGVFVDSIKIGSRFGREAIDGHLF